VRSNALLNIVRKKKGSNGLNPQSRDIKGVLGKRNERLISAFPSAPPKRPA